MQLERALRQRHGAAPPTQQHCQQLTWMAKKPNHSHVGGMGAK
jgi:hypothetical protein